MGVFVLFEDGVENCVWDLVCDFVWMVFGDGFGCEEIIVCYFFRFLCGYGWFYVVSFVGFEVVMF